MKPETPDGAYLRGRFDGALSTPRWRRIAVAALIGAVLAFGLGYAVGRADAAPRSAQTPMSADRLQSTVAESERTGAPHTEGTVGPVLLRLPGGAPPSPMVAPAALMSMSGTASWHSTGRSGMYAAAGPALRVGDWRGRVVTVCAERCIRVTLTDWCACPSRLIDLSDEAFAALAPLSRGLLEVTIR